MTRRIERFTKESEEELSETMKLQENQNFLSKMIDYVRINPHCYPCFKETRVYSNNLWP